MRSTTRGSAVARMIAALGLVVALVIPMAPVTESPPPPAVTLDVRLAAAAVPPGGLITSFLGNQVVYCSIICPLLVRTAVTAAATTVLTPVTFLNAARSGNLLKAFGAAAASVTGPTNEAAQATILADGTRVAPRALNAFQVGVVGLLNVLPAAADGLPGIVRALQTAREDTYTALNLPIVPNPAPTVRPRGVLQVVVVEVINVGAAVIFPGLNHVLSAVFEAPDAFAQELAATGDPVRAVVAGVSAAARRLEAAGTVVAEAVDTAVRNVGTAVEESRATTTSDEATSEDSTSGDVEEADSEESGDDIAVESTDSRRTHKKSDDEETGAESSRQTSVREGDNADADRPSRHRTKHDDSGDRLEVRGQRRIDHAAVGTQ